VNGIGEASNADFGITGAKNEGLIFAGGKAIRKVKTAELVDELFVEIDKARARDGKVEIDANKSAEGAEWLRKIEEENAGDLTPEKLAALEAEKAREGDDITEGLELPQAVKVEIDETASPQAGRRFARN
jgi:(E)-4-hydroxy-3-methylbut-2-enyl-diphosphate synthase